MKNKTTRSRMISDHTVTQLAAGCCRLVNSRLLCATRQGSSHIDRCMLALIDIHVNSFHDCLWSVATLGAFSVDIKMPNLHRLAKLSQVLLTEFALIPLGQPHCKMIQPCKTVILVLHVFQPTQLLETLYIDIDCKMPSQWQSVIFAQRSENLTWIIF